jgi:hypothetical protein
MTEIKALRYIFENHKRIRPEIDAGKLLGQWLLGSVIISLISFGLCMLFYDSIKPRYLWELTRWNKYFVILQGLMFAYPSMIIAYGFSGTKRKIFRIGGIVKILTHTDKIDDAPILWGYNEDLYYRLILEARKKHNIIKTNIITLTRTFKFRMMLISIAYIITKLTYATSIVMVMYVLSINMHRNLSIESTMGAINLLSIMGSVPIFTFIVIGISGYIQNNMYYTYKDYPDWENLKKLKVEK